MWSHYQILVQDSKFSQDWWKFGSLGSLSSMEFFLVSTNWRVVSLLDPFRGFPPDPGGSSQILQRSQKARDTLDESTESRKLRCWPFLGGTHDFQRCALYSFMTWTCEASTLLRSSNSNQKKSRPPGCGACGIMSSVCLTLVLTYQWDIICHLWKCWSILKPEAPRHQTSDVLQRSAPNSQCLTKEGFKPSISTQFHQNLCMQLSAQIQDASIFSYIYIYRFVLRSDVVLQKSNPRSTKPGHQVARVAQLLVGWFAVSWPSKDRSQTWSNSRKVGICDGKWKGKIFQNSKVRKLKCYFCIFGIMSHVNCKLLSFFVQQQVGSCKLGVVFKKKQISGGLPLPRMPRPVRSSLFGTAME